MCSRIYSYVTNESSCSSGWLLGPIGIRVQSGDTPSERLAIIIKMRGVIGPANGQLWTPLVDVSPYRNDVGDIFREQFQPFFKTAVIQ